MNIRYLGLSTIVFNPEKRAEKEIFKTDKKIKPYYIPFKLTK
ncbi:MULTISPECIES: hypothetical protein [Chitinophaga]|nr:hypothetical protein [Chitinophaga ginsengisegetis]MDR6645069.1 hypothetical protein [Chitinophaga ginsengisegetis]MDR6652339.1 hypothetical protein [Chitinophaga ginsengisegetis]